MLRGTGSPSKGRRPRGRRPSLFTLPPAADMHRTPNPRVGAGFYPARLSRTPNHAPVGGGACPPSCQPIPVHCRGRQSGHFLETGSLLPPPAALCRFPRRPVSPHPLICPCRAAPMCAAADMHRTPNHAPVGGGVPDAPHDIAPPPCPAPVGRGDPVAVPKIFTLPYGGRLKF